MIFILTEYIEKAPGLESHGAEMLNTEIGSLCFDKRGDESAVKFGKLISLAIYQNVFVQTLVVGTLFLYQFVYIKYPVGQRRHPHICIVIE